MSRYKNKHIAIVGLSVEGIDSAEFFKQQQADITFCDRRTKSELGKTFTKLSGISTHFQLGPGYLSGLHRFDYIVRTPGMSPRTPELIDAQKKGSIVTSLTKLFFAHCPSPIIGVTGTKGKGTTATLIHNILETGGKRVWLGGNVGIPLLSRVRDMKRTDIVILELSSFQLEDLTQSPHIAVVLKITQEHLANFDPMATNYHESRESYVKAKEPIVRYQDESDFVVYNKDDVTSSSFVTLAKSHAFSFSRINQSSDCFVKDDTVILRWKETNHVICKSADIHLLGAHNLENIAAAALAGVLSGVTVPHIRSAVFSFKGLEHRLELVRVKGGVSYYNDSFSTVPETTIAAIESFRTPLILIVGGSEKGSDFTQLGKVIARSLVRTLLAIGAMSERITESARSAGFGGEIITDLTSMHDIVKVAKHKAHSGDIVLLSPACASFDMFPNYKERGLQFKKEVMAIV